MLVSQPSKAGVSDALYDDVKTVIEDLLTAEVSQSVVPAIVCRSGHKESTSSVAVAIAINEEDGSPKPPLYTFEATEHFPRSFQRIYNRQYGSLKTTIREESANLAGFLVYQALKAAAGDPNATELATSQAQVGKAVDAQVAPAAATSDVSFAKLTDDQIYVCGEGMRDQFAKNAFSHISAYPVDSACQDIREEKKTQHDSYGCNLAFATRAALLGELGDAQDALTKAAAAALFERFKVKDDELQGRVVLLLRRFLASDSWDAAVFDAAIADLTTPAVGATRTAAANEDALLAHLKQLRQLHAVWRASINRANGTLGLASFVRIAAVEGGFLLGTGCVEPSCKMMAGFRDRATAVVKNALPMIQLTARGEYREMAQLVTRYVFQTEVKADVEGVERDVDIYKRFAESVVMYTLDVSDDRVPSQATREAFRAAAVDVIRELGKSGGIRRKPMGKPILLPDFGLRLSWSASYVNIDDETARVVASINWLNFRLPLKRGNVTHFGLELSLIDPLAPLSELIFRRTKDTTYRAVNRLAWNVVAPRLEFEVASPALSEHLVLSAGATLRLVAPLVTKDSTDLDPIYEYRRVWDTADEGETRLPRFFEFGLTAKYVL